MYLYMHICTCIYTCIYTCAYIHWICFVSCLSGHGILILFLFTVRRLILLIFFLGAFDCSSDTYLPVIFMSHWFVLFCIVMWFTCGDGMCVCVVCSPLPTPRPKRNTRKPNIGHTSYRPHAPSWARPCLGSV